MTRGGIIRERLDALIASGVPKAPHLLPLLLAVRNDGIGLMVLEQSGEPFMNVLTAAKGPFIALIGDDTDRTVGPGFYHQPSLRRLISLIGGAAVVSSTPPVEAYTAMACATTILRVNTVIVETRIEQEIPWITALRGVQPNLPMIVATVHGGRA